MLVAVGINVNPPDPPIPGGLLTETDGRDGRAGSALGWILFYDIL